MKITVLSREDIKKVLTLGSVIEKVNDVYCFKSEDKTVVWPSIEYHFNGKKAAMDIRSGYIEGEKIHGAKMLNNFPLNKELNLPSFTGLLMIYDSNTGLPLGILDASYITSMRTGAAAALGIKALGRDDIKNLLIVGSGRQAIYMIASSLTTVPQIEKVRVYDPLKYEDAKSFIGTIKDKLNNEFNIDNLDRIEFSATNNLSKALGDTDAVITVTRATSPIVKREWVRPGTHFSCIGADMFGKEEIDPTLFEGARVFVDDISQCIRFGEMEIPYRLGIVTKESIDGELGDVLIGRTRGRTSEEEITIFDATGLALLDLAVGKLALILAKAKSIGTVVEI